MSNTALDTTNASYEAKPRKAAKQRSFVIFVCVWIVLIASGLTGAKLYSDHVQQQIAADVERQTASQIAVMQKQYEDRIAKLETDYKAELSQLDSKVEALNELLTFSKDNADVKTDNSNKLYSQLNEVKKKLNELQKNLDVLK
jgi:DNA replication protein DnaC